MNDIDLLDIVSGNDIKKFDDAIASLGYVKRPNVTRDWIKPVLTFSSLMRLVAAGLLFYALKRHPYGYYSILRWVTCGTALYCCHLSIKSDKGGWLLLFAVTALLFNPIAPIGLDKKTWAIIDVVTAVYFVLSVPFVQSRQQGESSKGQL
jgi:hypothetical protein